MRRQALTISDIELLKGINLLLLFSSPPSSLSLTVTCTYILITICIFFSISFISVFVCFSLAAVSPRLHSDLAHTPQVHTLSHTHTRTQSHTLLHGQTHISRLFIFSDYSCCWCYRYRHYWYHHRSLLLFFKFI